MDVYLGQTLPSIDWNGHDLTLVLGNESGDLDSLVSSVCLAKHLDQNGREEARALPALAFPK